MFYIKLLGIVGDAEDVHYLEPLVFGPRPGAPDLHFMHSEATGSYLKLAGASAGRKLIDAVSPRPLQDAAEDGEVKPDWVGMYQVYMAVKSLRHQSEFEPIYQATSKLMLDETPFADVVLHNARSDRDARWIDDAIRIYGRSEEDYVRNAALVYLHVIRRDRPDTLSAAQQEAVGSLFVEAERDHPQEIVKVNRTLSFLCPPAAEQ